MEESSDLLKVAEMLSNPASAPAVGIAEKPTILFMPGASSDTLPESCGGNEGQKAESPPDFDATDLACVEDVGTANLIVGDAVDDTAEG